MPGLEVNFSQPIRDNVNENISGQFGQIAVKLYGDDLVALQAQAEKAEGSHRQGAGRRRPGHREERRGAPDPGHARPRGARALRNAAWATSSTCSRPRWADGRWRTSGKASAASTWSCALPLAARDDVEKIRCSPGAGGGRRHLVALGALAEVGTGVGRASINRENGRRYIGIRMNVRGRDLGGFVDEASGQRRAGGSARRGHGHRVGRRVREQGARDGAAGAWWSRSR